jgi:hypothetical protein
MFFSALPVPGVGGAPPVNGPLVGDGFIFFRIRLAQIVKIHTIQRYYLRTDFIEA